jgi:hypothetical protein
MPRGIGSEMKRGNTQGVFFCAAVGDRTYLPFVPKDESWSHPPDTPVLHEIGTCLRLIECEKPRFGTSRMLSTTPSSISVRWARSSIHQVWMEETDPANLQPKVHPLNQCVAELIRSNRPTDGDGSRIDRALDIYLRRPGPCARR